MGSIWTGASLSTTSNPGPNLDAYRVPPRCRLLVASPPDSSKPIAFQQAFRPFQLIEQLLSSLQPLAEQPIEPFDEFALAAGARDSFLRT
jgi:hypothetical protein